MDATYEEGFAIDHQKHVRNILLDVVLSLLTCMLYNAFVVQPKQMEAVNEIIGEEKYKFLPWFLLSVVTFGVWHVFHEFRMSDDLVKALGHQDDSDNVVHLILAALGLPFVADALRQSILNDHFGPDVV